MGLMRASSVALVLVCLASPAFGQAGGVPRLSVRRADASSTGMHPFQLDAVLRSAFAEEALSSEPTFELVSEYEADVIVGVHSESEPNLFRVVFELSTTRLPVLKDRATVDLQRAEVGIQTARLMVKTVALRAKALLHQAELAASEGALQATAPPAEDDGRPGPFTLKLPPPREWGRLDVVATGGLSTPAGYVGARVGLNPFSYVGLTFAAGYSSWGARVSPGARVYPFGLDLLGLYGELDAFVSLGQGAAVVLAGQDVAVQLKSTLSVAPMLGYRQQLLKWLVAEVYLGWAFRLASENVSRDDGQPVDKALLDSLEGRQPQGFIAGVALGASFF
ncbi:MAG: hypothetical protein IT380_21370 [Myxococcales bacterium]|nr:hypothetical protein [Myxococcales bacterium]